MGQSTRYTHLLTAFGPVYQVHTLTHSLWASQFGTLTHSPRPSQPGTHTHSLRPSLPGTHTHSQPPAQSTRYTHTQHSGQSTGYTQSVFRQVYQVHTLTAFGPVYQVSYYKYTGYYKFTALLTELCSLKGTVRRDFQFFSSFQPACATDQWVKIFLILVKFSPSYLHFYESPWGLILRRVNLPRVSYPGESYDFSRSYLKGQYNQIVDMFFFIIQACLGH